MSALTDIALTSLDDLDLTDCIVGPDLVASVDEQITLYRRDGHVVELLGVFDRASDAFAALDGFDAPGR
jgi:hypothetical protein